MSTETSKAKYPIGLHILRNRMDGEEVTFEWTGTGWSTPGTRYETRDVPMRVLGWDYLCPAAPPEERKPQ